MNTWRTWYVRIAVGVGMGCLLLSSSLFVAPRPAYALFGLGDIVHDPINWIQENVSAVFNGSTAASTLATQIKGYVLDPLAHLLAQAVLMQITASVVNSINGKNGSPQFVQNLAGNLQQVGDRVGLAFIGQFGSSINSPFAAAISGALRNNYLQGTSLAGFYAANQCTLNQYSSNINSFLGGNFNQGGWGTWFALTTQDQNNPYTLYQRGYAQLASAVSGAQANQRQTINQNNGFLSWCSSGSLDTSGAGLGASCSDFANGSDCNGNFVCVTSGGSGKGTCQQPTAATSNDTAQTCYNKDGTPGTVDTPGSVLHDALSKATGSGIDSLVSVHDFNQSISIIFAALVTKIVSSGLSALSGGGGNSYTSQLQNGGATDPNASAIATQASSQAQTVLTQLTNYTTAWNTIQAAAQTASTNLTTLSSSCSSQSNAAQTALQTIVTPVLSQTQAAQASAASARTLALRVQSESTGLSNGTAGASGALTADTQALAAAPPTATDIATAQANATQQGGATSSPAAPLIVSGGTIVDQMNLLTQNAQTLTNNACGG